MLPMGSFEAPQAWPTPTLTRYREKAWWFRSSQYPGGSLDDRHLGQGAIGAPKAGLWTQILMAFQVSECSNSPCP